MKSVRSNVGRPSAEPLSPDRSKKLVTVSTWKTDRQLKIVAVTNLSGQTMRSLPEKGQILSARRKNGFLEYQAHADALGGKRVAYEFALFRYAYTVVVTPRRDRRRRIVGVEGKLKIDVSSGDGFKGLYSTNSQDKRRLNQMLRRRKSNNMKTAIRSLEIARAVSDTLRIATETRNARLVAATERALQAQARAEAGERRARFLADASAILDSSFDPQEIYDRLARLAVTRFADWFVIQIRSNQSLRRVALHCRNPQEPNLLERIFPAEMLDETALQLFQPGTLEPGLVEPGLLEAGLLEAGLLEAGLLGVRPRFHELFSNVTEENLSSLVQDGTGMEAARELKGKSIIRTTLISHGRRIGYLTLGSDDAARRFDLQDLRTIRELASRIAMTRENLLLYEEAQKEIAMRKEIEARMRVLNSELERRVSDRTRLLEEATREANSFAYTVAHDLRAPLRAISGFCQALKEDYESVVDSQGRDYLARIVTGARKMDDLIRDLLDYARINRADIQRNYVELDDLLDDVLHGMVDELQERKARVAVAKPLGRVVAHGPVLLQVLTNLISNATKFVAPGVQPLVTVRTEKRNRRLRILIQDNGIGIDPEHHERIFGIFERLNRAEEYPGTGIGLAIVRRAIERLGGSVGVESAPNSGSTFWVELPPAS
jgi:signal transduction histidine kinase